MSRSVEARMPVIRVCIAAAPEFQNLAQGIALFLGDRGLQSRVGQPDVDDAAVVVVLGNEVPTGIREMLDLPGRLVPVAFGEVTPNQLPPQLAALNWIPWNPSRSAQALEAIYRACLTELDMFFKVQSLEARASGWEASGRRSADLVRTKKELRQLLGGSSVFMELSPQARAFVEESAAATWATMKSTWMRRLVWGVLSAIILVGVWQAVKSVQHYRERKMLFLLASAPTDDLGPVAQVPKFAGLVLLSDELGEPVPFDGEARLAKLLSQPAPVEFFAIAPNDMFLTRTAMAADGDMLQLSGDGTVWSGEVGDPQLKQLASVPHLGYFIAADASLATWAVSDGGQITASQSGRQVTLGSELGEGVSGLRMQSDGELLVAWGDDRSAEVYTLDGGFSRVYSATEVLATGEVSGALVLVKRQDDAILVLDASTGTEIDRIVTPGDVDAATVLGDGTLVVVAGQRLWVQSGEDLVNLGIAVPTAGRQLEATTDQEVLLTTVGDGTRLVDTSRGVVAADVCAEGSALSVDISDGGRWVVCGYGSASWIWDAQSLRPTAAGSTAPGASTAEQDGTSVRLTDGLLEINRDGEAVIHDPAKTKGSVSDRTEESDSFVQGSLTAVALSPGGDSIAYGTDAGEVVVADLSESMELLVTHTWTGPAATPVSSLDLAAGQLEVTTASGTWALHPCTGCRIDRATLMAVQQDLQLACYPSSFGGLLPARIQDELGLSVCYGAGS